MRAARSDQHFGAIRHHPIRNKAKGTVMRVLVSAASTHGATAEIGQRIAETLRHHGLEVDVAKPEDVADLDCYSGFVLGSAIYRGRWKQEATDMLRDRAEVITSRPCWLFSSGPIAENAPSEPIRPDEVADLLAVSGAIEHRLFGGRLDIERLTPRERWIARWVKVRDGDARPWNDIDRWAIEIAAELIAGPAGIPAVIDVRPPGQAQERSNEGLRRQL